jgi:[acyl-carrier-protein] S-malonyltransferase
MRRADRGRFIELPEVQEYFKRAEAALASRLNLTVNLNQLVQKEKDEIYAIENLSLAAVIICSIQCGVYKKLESAGLKYDWLMGCSLGDNARAIAAGSYLFEDAVVNHVHFTKNIEGVDKIGANIGVAAKVSHPFSSEDMAWFEEIGTDASHLTPRFLNIGGRFKELQLIRERAKEKRWAVMPILDYPAHSRYIAPYVEKVEDEYRTVSMTAPQKRIFSSLSCKELKQPEEIREEILLCITKTIHWHRAIETLVSEKNVTEFINIGPCRSLSGMMKDIPVDAKLTEASELIFTEEAAD